MATLNLKKESEEYICTCGASSTLPNCDGTHTQVNKEKGVLYRPLVLCAKSEVEIEINSENWKK